MSSTEDRRAKARAAAPKGGGGANVIVVGGIVVVLAIAIIVVGAIWAGTRSGGGDGGDQVPAGVEMGQPIEPFAAANPPDDAPVVDVYEDFRCPICQVFAQTMGTTITELAQDGTIRLRVHLKTVIDTNTGGNSSAVAGSSAICAMDQGVWPEYHQALFAMQPETETKEGFDRSTFTRAATEAGLEGEQFSAWQECTDADTYVRYVQSVDDATVEAGITGTPVIAVNGTELSWGALIDEQTARVDTERFTEVLTSGTVPQDLVSTR